MCEEQMKTFTEMGKDKTQGSVNTLKTEQSSLEILEIIYALKINKKS